MVSRYFPLWLESYLLLVSPAPEEESQSVLAHGKGMRCEPQDAQQPEFLCEVESHFQEETGLPASLLESSVAEAEDSASYTSMCLRDT